MLTIVNYSVYFRIDFEGIWRFRPPLKQSIMFQLLVSFDVKKKSSFIWILGTCHQHQLKMTEPMSKSWKLLRQYFFFLVKEVGTSFPLSQLQQTSHWKRVINFLRINVCFALNNIVIQLRNDSFCVCGWGCWNATYDIPGKKMMNLHRKCFVPCLQKHQDMSAGIIKRLTVYIWTSIRRKESCLPSPGKITYGKARFGIKWAVPVVANTDICPFS